MKEIFTRRSIRKYTKDPVSEVDIQLLLRAAMAAPSACNQQPWEFVVTDNPATIKALCRCSAFANFATKAPLMIVPCMRKNCRLPAFAPVDLSAATQNLLLEANHLGLGACWIGMYPQTTRRQAVHQLLNLPDNLDVFALVAVGHPAQQLDPVDRYEEKRIHRV